MGGGEGDGVAGLEVLSREDEDRAFWAIGTSGTEEFAVVGGAGGAGGIGMGERMSMLDFWREGTPPYNECF